MCCLYIAVVAGRDMEKDKNSIDANTGCEMAEVTPESTAQDRPSNRITEGQKLLPFLENKNMEPHSNMEEASGTAPPDTRHGQGGK